MNDNVLMYSTHNEGKSVAAEGFLRTLKDKIYRKKRANNSRTYLGYFNKLVDKFNHTYHRFIDKKTY